jgi:hypothetical protein
MPVSGTPNNNTEGYSLGDMARLVADPLGESCPVYLQQVSDADYAGIPILNQFKYLLNLIHEQGELKLTAKSYLPPKLVAELYGQGYMKDYDIERGITKLHHEHSCLSVNLTRILLELSGLVKKRKNVLTFTAVGKKISQDNHLLLKAIFMAFGSKFRWSYYDGYGDHPVGQMGYAYSLVLLHKYGHEQRPAEFYGTRYFEAFPHLAGYVSAGYQGDAESNALRCYNLRTFERFLDYFGLIEIGERKQWDSPLLIRKSELFDRLIGLVPPSFE